LPGKTITSLPNQLTEYLPTKQRLLKSSLDIDILTALFKERTQVKTVLPRQLNAHFIGNIYAGHCTDIYQIHYKKIQWTFKSGKSTMLDLAADYF